MTDAVAGFAHHHTDDALRRWIGVPADRKLQWLHEALELTREMLPSARRAAWMRMRGEEAGAAVPLETLDREWPAFLAALAAGAAGVEALGLRLIGEGCPARDAREILLALRAWLPMRRDAGPDAATAVDAALRRLGG
jgi:hypothetical protein